MTSDDFTRTDLYIVFTIENKSANATCGMTAYFDNSTDFSNFQTILQPLPFFYVFRELCEFFSYEN